MAKIRGNSLYTGEGDKEYDSGAELPIVKEVNEFCEGFLDKKFENWMLVARDVDPKNYKEADGGTLLSGVVMYNVKSKPTKRANKSNISHMNRKGHIAMMILDLVEGLCDNEEETEKFLEALLETAQHLHSNDDSDKSDDEPLDREGLKLKVLKDFLDEVINSFDTYEGKERFLKSCIGSALPARVFESGSSSLKRKMRESMKASIRGDKDKGAFVAEYVDSVTDLVDAVLDAIDEGKDPDEVLEKMKEIAESMGIDRDKLSNLG